MAHVIEEVLPHSLAERYGFQAGDLLVAINGEPILDEIDYQALIRHTSLHVEIERGGEKKTLHLVKAPETPLGLKMSQSLCCEPRRCHNDCVFCFIDQLPRGMRKTLYVKDDDWRLSLMMGNYVTLTNVDEAEFERILRRKASPLYISVHTTNPELRSRMMNNKFAGQLMERLNRLKEAGLRFHCQLVLCPGWNDGAELEKTLMDLAALYPAAQSVALVPVGLTSHREGLEKLHLFDVDSARAVLRICERFQKTMLEQHGTRFVFAADEMVLIAKEPLPEDDAYESYPQIENGVGLLRSFEMDLRISARMNQQPARERRVLIPCGTAVAPLMAEWMRQYAPKGVEVQVQPIVNHFFGESITVSGLLTGKDLCDQLQTSEADEILLASNMLRAEGDLFLDDLSLQDLRAALKPNIIVVPNDGASLFDALLG